MFGFGAGNSILGAGASVKFMISEKLWSKIFFEAIFGT
jgi:hypothetical protein